MAAHNSRGRRGMGRWRRRLATSLGVLFLSGCMSGRQALAEEFSAGRDRPRISDGMMVTTPEKRGQSPDQPQPLPPPVAESGTPVMRLRKEANTSGITPVSGTSISIATGTAPLPITADARVKIVAMVGTTPIYESEIREAINQRLFELVRLTEDARAIREREIFQEELKRIIERELIIDDMVSKLKKARPQLLESLGEDAAKEADKRLREFRRTRNIPTEAEFLEILENQGLSIAGMRRQIERNFLMGQYIGNLIGPKAQRVSLTDIQDYYRDHPKEFITGDELKWQDIFIRYDKFASPAEAKAFAQQLMTRARAGEDFLVLAKQFDQGDSTLRGGYGGGEKRGEIQPVDAETILFQLQPGQVGPLIEMDSGIHIVRVAERVYAGQKPFNVATQVEIRKRVQAQIANQEVRKILDELKRRTPVVITMPN